MLMSNALIYSRKREFSAVNSAPTDVELVHGIMMFPVRVFKIIACCSLPYTSSFDGGFVEGDGLDS